MENLKKFFYLISLLLIFFLLTSFDGPNPDDEYSLEEMQKGIADNGYSFTVGDTGLSDYTISGLCGFTPPSYEDYISEIKNPVPVS